MYEFHCDNCDNDYTGTEPGCPKCGSASVDHFGSISPDQIDNYTEDDLEPNWY